MTEKYKWICGTIIISIFLICSCLLMLNQNPYTIRFEADDNMRMAMESMSGFQVTQIETQDVVIAPDESEVTIYIKEEEGYNEIRK